MLHTTITRRYANERTIYLKLLRACFAAAGLFWILLYLSPTDEHTSLRAGQTTIYFILLTIWGIDHIREQKRLRVVILAANAHDVRPDAITFDDITERASLFMMLRPRGIRLASLIPMLFVLGLTTAWVLVILQYGRAVSILMR